MYVKRSLFSAGMIVKVDKSKPPVVFWILGVSDHFKKFYSNTVLHHGGLEVLGTKPFLLHSKTTRNAKALRSKPSTSRPASSIYICIYKQNMYRARVPWEAPR